MLLRHTRTAVALAVLTLWSQLAAGSTARLQDGTPIEINDTTRSVRVLGAGRDMPLWDGVHRLADGTTITVDNGILINRTSVPTRPLALEGPPGPYTRCEVLVHKVCGEAGQCRAAAACSAARQLLDMEAKEREPDDPPSKITPTSASCIDALNDEEFFTPCAKPEGRPHLPPRPTVEGKGKP